MSSAMALPVLPVGEGSRFDLNLEKLAQTQVSIYVVRSVEQELVVEYFFAASPTVVPVEMWQQYVLGQNNAGTFKVRAGYFYVATLKAPEIIPPEYLCQPGAFVLEDFLFAKPTQISAFRLAMETVIIPFSPTPIIARHFRQVRDEHTIEYWISEEIKPISLVKLLSKGKQTEHNYQLALRGLIKNAKPKIDLTKVVPLSSEGKQILSEPKTRILTY